MFSERTFLVAMTFLTSACGPRNLGPVVNVPGSNTGVRNFSRRAVQPPDPRSPAARRREPRREGHHASDLLRSRETDHRTDKACSANSTLPSCTETSLAEQPAAVPCTGRAGPVARESPQSRRSQEFQFVMKEMT